MLASKGKGQLMFDEFMQQNLSHVVFDDILHIAGVFFYILETQKHVFVLYIGCKTIFLNNFFYKCLVQRFHIGFDDFILGIKVTVECHAGNIGNSAKFRNGDFTVRSIIQLVDQSIDDIFQHILIAIV